MFHFKLRPVDDIEPWGPPPSLSYFGLTDGAFWMRVGEHELFRYTPEVLDCWKSEAREQGPQFDAFGEPYDSYQVMQLADDLEQMLPDALEVVPPEVAAYVDVVDAWRRAVGAGPVPLDVIRAFAAKTERECSAIEETFYAATQWWGDRQMPIMHLRISPVIHIWSEGNEVEIRWDNRTDRYKGIPVWTAEAGKARFSRSSFIEAVQDFRQRFMSQMGKRVNEVCRNWSRPEIAIDLEQLKKSHHDTENRLLRNCTSSSSGTDVRYNLERIKNQCRE